MAPQPQLLSVESAFGPYHGKRTYLATFPGSNGDRLILRGARMLLARRHVVLVDRPEQAELLVLVGGGMMIGPHGGRQWLARLCRRFPSTDLILLPSTFSSESIAPALAGRAGRTILFARDPVSLQALQEMDIPGPVELGLDHDVSLELEHSAVIDGLRASATARHILIVERTDVESISGSEFWSFLERPLPRGLRLIPGPIRRAARSALILPRRLTLPLQLSARARTPCAIAARRLLLEDLPQAAGLPLVALDIGQTSVCGFDTYCRYVAGAAAVYTTRLHVAILSAMLGKPSYVDCHAAKLREVVNYSLSRFPNVRPVDTADP